MMNQQHEKTNLPGNSPLAHGSHHDAAAGHQRGPGPRLQKGLPAGKKNKKSRAVPADPDQKEFADAINNVISEIDLLIYEAQAFATRLRAKKKTLEQLAAAPAPQGGSVIDITHILANRRRALHKKINKA